MQVLPQMDQKLPLFQEAYCITLARRPERYQTFLSDLPDVSNLTNKIVKFDAIDGKNVPHPKHWKPGGGAWGCFRSHYRIIEDCLNRGVDSVLLLEDDCKFSTDFISSWPSYRDDLPDDWGMVYLGGQHLHAKTSPPIPASKLWYQPFNVNRTHAYGLRGNTMKAVYKHLSEKLWQTGHHIDHHLGIFHQKRQHPIYAPGEWLAVQRGNKSDIANREFAERTFPSASDLTYLHSQFVAVLGLHSSGSSVTAMILKELGVHMGNVLIGYHGACEPKHLARLMEQHLPLSETKGKLRSCKFKNRLSNWIIERTKEARRKNTIAGAKYPQLCAFGDILSDICGDALRIINVERPLQDSIESINKRVNKDCSAHQNYLWIQRKAFLRRHKEFHTVDYYKLMQDPVSRVDRLVSYLQLDVTDAQKLAAIRVVDTSRKSSIAKA